MNESANLYRAHSTKYLQGKDGYMRNPNQQRSRLPRDIPQDIHSILSSWFIDKFKKNYRGNSIFCTGNLSIAKGYVDLQKTLIKINPIGEYSLCYSPECKDLYAYYLFNWKHPSKNKEEIILDLESLGFVEHHNSGIEIASESGNEIMIIAEHFKYTVVDNSR